MSHRSFIHRSRTGFRISLGDHVFAFNEASEADRREWQEVDTFFVLESHPRPSGDSVSEIFETLSGIKSMRKPDGSTPLGCVR